MFKKSIAGVFAAAVFAGVANAEINFDQNINVADILNSKAVKTMSVPSAASNVKAVNAKGSRETTWTIMVYINAKNNLEQFGLKDVNEMEMIGSTEKVKVVAELGRIPGYDSSDGNWTGSRRYLIQKDNNPRAITSPVLAEIPKSDMGDYRHLVEFVKWAKTNYPSGNYLLVVWNHGAGWLKGPRNTVVKGISYDDATGNHITTEQLGLALREVGGVDVYASDACLMQMASVDYEIMDSVRYVVGSEETEPGDGWTYDTFLNKVVNDPYVTAMELGKYAVDAYADHYVSINQDCTQALVSAGSLRDFAARLDAWTRVVMAANEPKVVLAAKNGAVGYAYSDNKSLWQFVDAIGRNSANEEVRRASADLNNFLLQYVVKHNRTNGYKYNAGSKGLAIYLPQYRYNNAYESLRFARESNWNEFAQWVLTLK